MQIFLGKNQFSVAKKYNSQNQIAGGGVEMVNLNLMGTIRNKTHRVNKSIGKWWIFFPK